MAANYYPILQATQAIINSLYLRDWNGIALPSAIRKLPKVDEEEIDTLPLLCIVPKDEPARRQPLCFGSPVAVGIPGYSPYYKVTYPVEIVWIVGGDRDFTSYLSFYMAWQSAIEAAFNLPDPLKAIVPSVWDVNVRPGLVIDRSIVNDNYDYGGLTVEVITSENN